VHLRDRKHPFASQAGLNAPNNDWFIDGLLSVLAHEVGMLDRYMVIGHTWLTAAGSSGHLLIIKRS
jgi:hypothetical protein